MKLSITKKCASFWGHPVGLHNALGKLLTLGMTDRVFAMNFTSINSSAADKTSASAD